MSFVPDIRNLGGRTAIAEHMGKHLAKMLSIKPVVSCRTPPRNHVDGLTPKNSTLVKKLVGHANQTFRRFASLERSFTRQVGSASRTKLLKSIGPKKKKPRKRSLNSTWRGPALNKTEQFIESLLHPGNFSNKSFETQRTPLSIKAKKSKSKIDTELQTKDTEEYLNSLDYVHTPKASWKDRDIVMSLSSQLKDIIVEQRVYKSKDLHSLIERMRAANRDLPHEQVELAISQAMLAINS